MKQIISLFLVFTVALLMVGCGEVPQADIDAAKAALDAAKKAEAELYVPDQYNAAKKSLDNAMAVVEEEKEATFSNYDEAVVQLQKAKEQSEAATAAAPAAKEAVQAEVTGLIAQIPAVVKETKMAWKKAPRGKGTHEPLQLIKKDIEATEASASEVDAALAQGDLLLARQKAQEIISKLKKLQSELQ